jgi:hypothetical protein
MKTQKLFVLVLAVAAFLVVGASNATACCTSEFSGWWVLAVESAPEEVNVGEDPRCKVAIDQLRQQGYVFRSMTNTGNEHTQVLYFEQRRVVSGSEVRLGNMVALFCLANIQTKLGDPDFPDGPGF